MPPESSIDSSRDELVRFLDREFDGVPGIADEFPVLTALDNLRHCRVLRDESGELLAHAAWRPMSLRCGAQHMLAAGIGLVTTASRARGRGLASLLVAECLAQSSEAGAQVALLFAPPRDLYTNLGFVPAGRERVTCLLPREQAADPRVRRGQPKDAEAILALLRAHHVGVERELHELEILLGVPDTRLHVLEESGRVQAYCVEGKGRDLQGVIHEWAGEPRPVETLLHAVVSSGQEPLWLLSPLALPAPAQGESAPGPVGLFRVLDPEAFGSEDPRALFGDAETPGRTPLYVWGLDSV